MAGYIPSWPPTTSVTAASAGRGRINQSGITLVTLRPAQQIPAIPPAYTEPLPGLHILWFKVEIVEPGIIEPDYRSLDLLLGWIRHHLLIEVGPCHSQRIILAIATVDFLGLPVGFASRTALETARGVAGESRHSAG